MKKIKAKDLKEKAKKREIKTSCVKKIEIAKQPPEEYWKNSSQSGYRQVAHLCMS